MGKTEAQSLTLRICRATVRVSFERPSDVQATRSYFEPALLDSDCALRAEGEIHVGSKEISIQRGPDAPFKKEHPPLYQLETVLLRWCSVFDPEARLLHAGGVVWRNRPILLVAPSGGGKSTITREAVRRGAAYVTDDLVSLRSTSLVGLARSIRFDGFFDEGAPLPRYLGEMDIASLRHTHDGKVRVVPIFCPSNVREEVETSPGDAIVVEVVRGDDAVETMSELERVRVLHEAAIRTGPEYDGSLGPGPTYRLSWDDPGVAFELLVRRMEADQMISRTSATKGK